MESITLAQAAENYLSSLEAGRQAEARRVVLDFVNWYGRDAALNQLQGPDIARYVESGNLGSGETAQQRAQALKEFLSYLRERKLVPHALAQHVRVRRAQAPRRAAPAAAPVEMTAEGYAALQAELESLKAQRPLIAEEIRRAALDKDFRENAPLQAAREKQSHLETRIREIESILRRAVIVDGPSQDESGQRVQLGSTVHLRNLADGRLLKYTVVGPGEASGSGGRISSASPVGRALLDRRPGDEVEVQVPAGRVRFRIEKIE